MNRDKRQACGLTNVPGRGLFSATCREGRTGMASIASGQSRMNRWVLPSVIAAVVGLGQILLWVPQAFGIPYRWLTPPQILVWQLANNVIATVVLAANVAALMMGVAAVVRINVSQGAERGKGLALAAIIITLVALLVPHVSWLIGTVIQLCMT